MRSIKFLWIIFFFVVTSVVTSGCVPKAAYIKKERAKEILNISNVSALPKTINVNKGERIQIKYKLSSEALVSVDIYDAEDRWVTSLKKDRLEKPGYNLIYWDGKDAKVRLLPSGVYIYVITAKDKYGRIAVSDPANETAGLGLMYRDLRYIKETGQIGYVLPRAARVRIRIGIQDGPLLRTLVDWQPREAGENFEYWDGLDNAGNPILKKPKLVTTLSAFTLPDNSIIVRNNNLGFQQECNFEVDAQAPKRINRLNIGEKVLHPHARHSRQRCHEPHFKIEFPEAVLDKKGLPLLSGIVPLRMVIDEPDKDMLVESRFEVIAFIDDVFLFEEEQGFSPFNYLWNTKGIAEGEHILTINVQAYDDHIGTRSLRIKIGEK